MWWKSFHNLCYHATNIFTSLRLDKFTPSARIHQPLRLTLGWKILPNWRHGSAVIRNLSHARARKIADLTTRIDGIIVFKNISEVCKCPHLIFHIFATIYCMRVQRMSSCFGEAIIERRLTQLVAEVKKAMSHQQLANINTIPNIVQKIQTAHKHPLQ